MITFFLCKWGTWVTNLAVSQATLPVLYAAARNHSYLCIHFLFYFGHFEYSLYICFQLLFGLLRSFHTCSACIISEPTNYYCTIPFLTNACRTNAVHCSAVFHRELYEYPLRISVACACNFGLLANILQIHHSIRRTRVNITKAWQFLRRSRVSRVLIG